jgi:hypothetical protein
MTLPVSDEGTAGILAVEENFYEFVPESELGDPAAAVLTCSEIEEGKNYFVILTTPGGLYRYEMNDIVRVAGFFNQTPLIEFVRKGRDVTNITGEKLHVNHVIEAMARAQSAAAVTVRHFRVWADAEKSRYTFYVELDGVSPSREHLLRLLQELDSCLREVNIEYAQKRDSRRLGAPVVCVMKAGWFEHTGGANFQLGARDVQFKARLLHTAPEEANQIQLVVDSAGE